MEKNVLMAISPLDGRYSEKVDHLRAIFSEYGLMKYRVTVEVKWLETLANVAKLSDMPAPDAKAIKTLDDLANHFSIEDAERIKNIESGINHDVKAVEYFIKEHIVDNKSLSSLAEYIHFGCTSEDINNLAYALMLNTARQQAILPGLDELLGMLRQLAHDYADIPMMARTHGQPATPTTIGKEIANTVARLKRQITSLVELKVLGKINGATGNYNAHLSAYPDVNWQDVSNKFVSGLGLEWNPYTTQIEPHDNIAEFFAIVIRINNILIDFNRDIWSYIAINYFKQKSVDKEVGSSTMPHKVNPIDFENAEGNLGIANALLEHMMNKLPISRWQRDLSDSTVLRNMGVALAHSVLAYQSTMKGVRKLEPNLSVISQDLDNHWEVLAEAVQTVMRRYKLEEPYEKLKAFTRGKTINRELLHAFIQSLDLPDDVKSNLLSLTPATYTGIAHELAKKV